MIWKKQIDLTLSLDKYFKFKKHVFIVTGLLLKLSNIKMLSRRGHLKSWTKSCFKRYIPCGVGTLICNWLFISRNLLPLASLYTVCESRVSAHIKKRRRTLQTILSLLLSLPQCRITICFLSMPISVLWDHYLYCMFEDLVSCSWKTPPQYWRGSETMKLASVIFVENFKNVVPRGINRGQLSRKTANVTRAVNRCCFTLSLWNHSVKPTNFKIRSHSEQYEYKENAVALGFSFCS